VTFVIAFLSIVAVIVLFNARGGGKGAAHNPRSAGDGDAIDDHDPSSIYAPGGLLETDPIGALARYGTPADAERLIDQGVDLEALGYRPPPPDDQRPWGR